jgi:hypothetical protein
LRLGHLRRRQWLIARQHRRHRAQRCRLRALFNAAASGCQDDISICLTRHIFGISWCIAGCHDEAAGTSRISITSCFLAAQLKRAAACFSL